MSPAMVSGRQVGASQDGLTDRWVWPGSEPTPAPVLTSGGRACSDLGEGFCRAVWLPGPPSPCDTASSNAQRSLRTASDAAVTADAAEIGFLMVIGRHRIQTLTSLLANNKGSQMHPENLKCPPATPGAGWGCLQSGGRDGDPERCRPGRQPSFLPSLDMACPGQAGPRPAVSLGAPWREGAWRPHIFNSFGRRARLAPRCPWQSREGGPPWPGAFNTREQGFCSRAARY